MAQALSSLRPAEEPKVTQTDYVNFLDAHTDADERVAEAVAERKDLRAKIKGAGIPLPAFDRARKDGERSGTVRHNEELWYRRMMAWQDKPTPGDEGSSHPPTVAKLKRIDTEGMDAGRADHDRDSNPYSPGTEEHQRWDAAFLRGQGERASDTGAETPKRRGRPLGSGKRQREAAAQAEAERRGLTVHEGGAGSDPKSGPETETLH